MKAITFKLCLLSLVVLFSQCSTFHFTDRKYTKGHYRDHSKDLGVKGKHSKGAELPEINAKTEISASDKTPVEKAPAGDVVTADAGRVPEVSTKESAAGLPKAAPKKTMTVKISEKTAKLLSRIPFSSTLLKATEKKQEAKSDGDHFVSTLLSIIGFAAGIISIIIAILAIVDSIAIEAVSGFFYMAIVIAVLAIACGIVALILGHGDLGGFEKTFSVLAIALGGAGLLIALIWSLLITAFITS